MRSKLINGEMISLQEVESGRRAGRDRKRRACGCGPGRSGHEDTPTEEVVMNIVGTAGDDNLTGISGDDFLHALGGNEPLNSMKTRGAP